MNSNNHCKENALGTLKNSFQDILKTEQLCELKYYLLDSNMTLSIKST